MITKNKTFVVTGAGGGVGKELVKELLERHNRVAALDISQASLMDLKKVCDDHPHLSIHQVDISDFEDVKKSLDQVLNKHGEIHGLINNAGVIQPFQTIETLDLERIDLVMKVNFYGTLHMIKVYLPELKKQEQGHILNVSSMGGFLPVPGQAAYGASKAAVMLLTEGMYMELQESSVKVTVVIPGGIQTDIVKNSNAGNMSIADSDEKVTRLLLTAKQTALQILDAIEKDKFRVYLGKDSKFINFLFKFFPRLAMGLIKKSIESKLKQ